MRLKHIGMCRNRRRSGEVLKYNKGVRRDDPFEMCVHLLCCSKSQHEHSGEVLKYIKGVRKDELFEMCAHLLYCSKLQHEHSGVM